MRLIRSIYLIINYKTLILTTLAVVSTWLCNRYHVVAEFPLTLVGIAIVFPVVFSIDSAYKRRERALWMLSDFKAHFIALYFASRDWIEGNEEFQNEIKDKLIDVYKSIRDIFTNGLNEEEQAEQAIYSKLSELSGLMKKFRTLGLPSGEISRVSQYISKITVAVENLKVIWNYRTPITLRAYSKVFIYSFPILYGPYFASVTESYSPNLEYMMPVIFSFILVSLDNIQSHLEDPFDQVGEDDIVFDVEEFAGMINNAKEHKE
jgi:ABC-type multidrug transport system fused ATPase/permease subunit